MKRRIIGIVTAVMLLLSGCGGTLPNKELQTSVLFAMDTVMNLKLYGDSALLLQAEDKIKALESSLSVTDMHSEIYALNHRTTDCLQDEALALLERSLNLCQRTDGALDITIYPVLRAWGFTTGDYRTPDVEELQALLKTVDYRQIRIAEGNRVTLPDGAQIDFGSVAKGYTGDVLVDMLRENGVTSALLNLGGNVHALGSKPDGTDWSVALENPSGDGYVGVLQISDLAVITSGGYERYFEQDGNSYCHIIDPKTGHPVENELASVTIVGTEGVLCDGLSTALFVMGLSDAIDFWRTQEEVEAVFITNEGELFITEGMESSFTPLGAYENAEFEVVYRD